MRRTIRSYRTRKNVYDTSAIRTQFIRELNAEAAALLKQLTEQFNQTLQTQMQHAFQGIVPGDAPTPTTVNEPGTIGSIGQLLATGARYLVSRPRTSRSSEETSRSRTSDAEFRLSRAQQMAEAQQAISRGEKNL